MAEPSHWLGVGRKKTLKTTSCLAVTTLSVPVGLSLGQTTENDKLPGSDHPQCPGGSISGANHWERQAAWQWPPSVSRWVYLWGKPLRTTSCLAVTTLSVPVGLSLGQTTENDKLPGSDHPQCPGGSISGANHWERQAAWQWPPSVSRWVYLWGKPLRMTSCLAVNPPQYPSRPISGTAREVSVVVHFLALSLV